MTRSTGVKAEQAREFIRKKPLIIAAYANGRKVKEIAAEFNVGLQTVYKLVAAKELSRNKPLTEETMQRIIQLYQGGDKLDYIVAVLGICDQTQIYQTLDRKGIPRRPRKG